MATNSVTPLLNGNFTTDYRQVSASFEKKVFWWKVAEKTSLLAYLVFGAAVTTAIHFYAPYLIMYSSVPLVYNTFSVLAFQKYAEDNQKLSTSAINFANRIAKKEEDNTAMSAEAFKKVFPLSEYGSQLRQVQNTLIDNGQYKKLFAKYLISQEILDSLEAEVSSFHNNIYPLTDTPEDKIKYRELVEEITFNQQRIFAIEVEIAYLKGIWERPDNLRLIEELHEVNYLPYAQEALNCTLYYRRTPFQSTTPDLPNQEVDHTEIFTRKPFISFTRSQRRLNIARFLDRGDRPSEAELINHLFAPPPKRVESESEEIVAGDPTDAALNVV